jgi:hypothetical protein
LANLDWFALNDTLLTLGRNYEQHYSSYHARILDTENRTLNICPLCGAYLCIERPPAPYRRYQPYPRHQQPALHPSALVCTNFPKCAFRKDLSDAAKLALQA